MAKKWDLTVIRTAFNLSPRDIEKHHSAMEVGQDGSVTGDSGHGQTLCTRSFSLHPDGIHPSCHQMRCCHSFQGGTASPGRLCSHHGDSGDHCRQPLRQQRHHLRHHNLTVPSPPCSTLAARRNACALSAQATGAPPRPSLSVEMWSSMQTSLKQKSRCGCTMSKWCVEDICSYERASSSCPTPLPLPCVLSEKGFSDRMVNLWSI